MTQQICFRQGVLRCAGCREKKRRSLFNRLAIHNCDENLQILLSSAYYRLIEDLVITRSRIM